MNMVTIIAIISAIIASGSIAAVVLEYKRVRKLSDQEDRVYLSYLDEGKHYVVITDLYKKALAWNMKNDAEARGRVAKVLGQASVINPSNNLKYKFNKESFEIITPKKGIVVPGPHHGDKNNMAHAE